jgi:hypothetical protein
VPDDKDTFGLQGVLSLDDVLSEVLSIVADLCKHVVDEEGLSEVVFVVRVRHRLEVKGHSCSALNIADLIAAGGRVGIGVEELGETLSVLGEQRIVETLFPLLIKVHHVVCLWAEETAQLLIGKQLIKNVDLIDCGLGTLVSDTSCSNASSGEEVQFPEGSMGEHHEAEATVANEAAGPHVVGTMQTGTNLVEIVTGAHSPFPVIGANNVGHVLELGWVSLGLGSLATIWSMVGSIGRDIVSIETLGRLEAHVVVAGLVVLSETELRGWGKESLALLLNRMKIK